MAACVNAFLGIIKGIAFFFTGNVAMFAEMMHSLGMQLTNYLCI